MAKKNQQQQQAKCLLGVLDERITDKHADVTWSTNKIGGRPDWMHPNIPFPRCRICDRQSSLAVQLYCPLDGSPYHRTIYVFGCINDSCWSNSDSWIAIRSQRLGEMGIGIGTVETCRRLPVAVDDWLENADDWEEDNGNLIRQQQSNNHQSWTNADQDNRNNVMDDDVDFEFDLDLNVDAGNNLIEGAVGVESEASAEMESPDEGTITVETPEGPNPETTTLLFSKPPSTPKDASVVLKSWFLAVIDEPNIQSQNQLNEHERELLARYQKRDGVNFNELFNSDSHTHGMGETYEKSLPKHGDRVFHKMLSKLSLCPQQLLRYSREGDGSSLFVAPASIEMLDPGNCQTCGEKRIFEFQLMPTTVDYLHAEDGDNCAMEFGTVVIYTCRASCWKDGDTWREERVCVQADPDDVKFRRE